MFTGLVESVGTVRSLSKAGRHCCLTVELDARSEDDRIGSSFAINGVCLTATHYQGRVVSFDVSPETLVKTTIGALRADRRVNVERALRMGDRLGGHMVQGHVDGTATIASIEQEGECLTMAFAAETVLLRQMVCKGSVAVDGISLTIVDVDEKRFTVALIPETLRLTTLGRARVGDHVNIETDIIGKTVMRYLETLLPRKAALTAERLQELGF